MGRILVVEFDEQDETAFDEILSVLRRHPAFERLRVSSNATSDAVLELPGIKIYPDSRKVFRDRQEINLTAKEFDLLYLLVANKGTVLTYEQIYEKVWGVEGLGNENNAVGCYIRNLREKLNAASPDSVKVVKYETCQVWWTLKRVKNSLGAR